MREVSTTSLRATAMTGTRRRERRRTGPGDVVAPVGLTQPRAGNVTGEEVADVATTSSNENQPATR